MKFFDYLKPKVKYLIAISLISSVLSVFVLPSSKTLANEPRFNFHDGADGYQGDYELFTGRNETNHGAAWQDPIEGNAGDIFAGSVYYHNGEINTVARNTTIKVTIPTSTSNKSATLSASISADNAETVSNTVIDGQVIGRPGLTVNLLDTDANIELVPGSVRWYPDANQQGSTTPTPLPLGQSGDEIIAGGVNIGDIQGCWPYAGFVTFQFRTSNIIAPNVSLEKTVRNVSRNESAFVKATDAFDNQQVEFSVDIKNTTAVSVPNVLVTDQLPGELEYVPGSFKELSGGHTTPLTDAMAARFLSAEGYSLTNVLGANEEIAYRFKAKVRDKILAASQVTNHATIIFGSTVLSDTACVNLKVKQPSFALSKVAFNRTTGVASSAKTVDGEQVQAADARMSDEIVYTLTTKNIDDQPHDLAVTDDISDILREADLIDKPAEATVVNGIITFPQVTINPDQSIESKFVVKVKNPLPNNPDADHKLVNIYGNKVVVQIVLPVNKADIQIKKTVRDFTTNEAAFVKANEAFAGDTLEYKIEYTNKGNTPADQVKVSDVLPPNTQYVPGTTTISQNGGEDKTLIDGITTAGGILLDTIAPNESSFLKFRVMTSSSIAAGEILTNTVTFKYGAVTVNDTAQTTVKAPAVVVTPAQPEIPALPRTGAQASASFFITFASGMMFLYAKYRQLIVDQAEIIKIASTITGL